MFLIRRLGGNMCFYMRKRLIYFFLFLSLGASFVTPCYSQWDSNQMKRKLEELKIREQEKILAGKRERQQIAAKKKQNLQSAGDEKYDPYYKDVDLAYWDVYTKNDAAKKSKTSLANEWSLMKPQGDDYEIDTDDILMNIKVDRDGNGAIKGNNFDMAAQVIVPIKVSKNGGSLTLTYIFKNATCENIDLCVKFLDFLSPGFENYVNQEGSQYGYENNAQKLQEKLRRQKTTSESFVILRLDSYCMILKSQRGREMIYFSTKGLQNKENIIAQYRDFEERKNREAEEKERERQRIAWEKERERQRIADEKFEKVNTLKASDGDVEAQYQLSLYYLRRGKYTKSTQWLEKCAQQNYKDSPKRLGMCYCKLYYYTNDNQYYEKALPWLEMAAKQGDSESQLALGKVYVTQKKYKEARLWLEAAPKNGDGVASLLRDCYVGLAREASQPNEAESWYKKAQQIESTEELTRELADFYFENGKYSQAEATYLGLSIPTSHDKKNLGEIYEKNAQSATSTKDKISWTEKAYKLSSSQLVHAQLQNLYVKYGDECEKSGEYVTAVDAYRNGTNYGSQVAKYKLANMYEKGLGVEKDVDVALSYHKENADAGYKPSQRKLVYGSGFILFESAFSNSPQASFGFSMGGVRKVGGYMKMRFSNLFSNTIISVNDALTDYPNTEKWTPKNKLLSISGGMLFRLGCPLHLNVGLGYGKRVQMYKVGEETVTTTTNRYVDDDDYDDYDDYNYGSTTETTSTTENVCVEDKKSTVKGLAADLGLLLYLKHFSLRAGVSTIQFKYTDIEIGVGLNFGKKYKK